MGRKSVVAESLPLEDPLVDKMFMVTQFSLSKATVVSRKFVASHSPPSKDSHVGRRSLVPQSTSMKVQGCTIYIGNFKMSLWGGGVVKSIGQCHLGYEILKRRRKKVEY
jgi:hypothetical protein